MTAPPPPPRLHVIPATGCDRALVLRRGPTMQVAACLWDRATGLVTLGQWLKARIYEHRSDLSPDGRHMIICARRGGRSWTALSRAPWLRALAFYPKTDTWFGGGAFTRDGAVFFNGMEVAGALPDGLRKAERDAYPSATDGFHIGGLFAAMMAARGWRIEGGTRYDVRLGKGLEDGWRLGLRFAQGYRSAAPILDHVYTLEQGDDAVDCAAWEWAEPWPGGVQYAAQGALWFLPRSPRGWDAPTLIHDFAAMTYESRQAPYEGVSR